MGVEELFAVKELDSVAALFAGLMLSLALIPIVRGLALRWGITDPPASGKVHGSPTPYLGGTAVAAATVAAAITLGGWRGQTLALLGAALLVASVGLLDDVRTAHPLLRLAVEAGAASIAFAAGARVQLVGSVGDWALTVVWLVVLTNAYNLLDNMDGCVACVVAVSAGGVLALALLGDQELVAVMAAAILGATLGFFFYNRYPASIFLGDAGSLFLGFLLSVAALKIRFPVDHGAGAIAIGFIAGPALFDTTLVVLARLASRRPIYVGGCDHTSHRLVRLGVPTRWVAPVLAAVTVGCGALGVAVGSGVLTALVVIPVVVLAGGALAILLRVPVYDDVGASRAEVLTAPAVARGRFSLAERARAAGTKVST